MIRLTSLLKTGAGRLTPEGAAKVLFLRQNGQTYQEIAKEMGVSVGTVRNIVKSESWKWLREEYAIMAIVR